MVVIYIDLMTHNGQAFCCASILCSVSRQRKPIEKLEMKLSYTVEIYSFSPNNS